MDKTAQNPDLPILLVDDDKDVSRAMCRTLRLNGFNNLISLTDSREVLPLLKQNDVALVLLDITMPYFSGDELLEEIARSFPHLPVIMATASDDIEVVVGCMKKGAFDFITKPIRASRLLFAIKCALDMRDLRRENEALRRKEAEPEAKRLELFASIITADQQMFKIFNYIEAIAPSSQPVLITGETGVGKELAARAIHAASSRKGSFIAVNVAGLDDDVFADTLFGHVKGAFTGADSRRYGQIRKAGAGTLFLDEIGDLSRKSQVKLLRLLQEKEYLPLGADTPRKSDARIVAATNHDLGRMVAENSFRKDLYFRLFAHQVELPPLRKRLTDLPLLVNHFVSLAAREYGRDELTIRPELYPLLENYAFPGNIRELKYLIFDAVSRQQGKILGLKVFMDGPAMGDRRDSVAVSQNSREKITFGSQLPTVAEMRRCLAVEALERSKGNISLAAKLIGLSRQSLSQYLRKHKIFLPDRKS
jgi:DNA-binding NtrC family response regulator